jgi:hyperosmotically inducible protein
VTDQPVADSANAADASPTPAVAGNAGPEVEKSSGDTDNTASDQQITSEVKSVLAVDSVAKDSGIAVNTSHGIVALAGSVPDQSALEHVVGAVQKVKDVRSVDASALTVTSL